MKLNTNIASLKVLNTMNGNNTRLEKSIERLSSGNKINKAADNATGLAISRKMQVQIDALSKASENAGDGISLIQTAEGALNEVHSILQRMRELAVQSSNGSLSTDDRLSAQNEIDMLKDEVNRISSTVQFNNMNLLDGSIDSKTYSNDENIAKVISSSEGVKAGTYQFKVEEAAVKTCLVGSPIGRILGEDGKTHTQGTIYINGAEANIKMGMKEDEIFAVLRDAAELSDVTCTTNTTKLVTMDGIENTSQLIFQNQISGEDPIKITGDDNMLYSLGLVDFQDEVTTYNEGTLAEANLADDIKAYAGKTYIVNGNVFTIPEDAETKKDIITALKGYDIAGLEIDDTTADVKIKDGFAIDANTVKETDGETLFDVLGMTLSSVTGTMELKKDGHNAVAQITSYDDPSSGKVVGFPAGTTVSAEGNLLKFNGPDGFELLVENSGTVGDAKLVITTQGQMDLQIGANNGQTMIIRIPNMSTQAIGIENVNIRTRDKAETAIVDLDEAIAYVSEVRSRLGAFQNRLDYTVNSLTSSEQNLTESLSRIQDTDMAEEMSTYTQNNILAEAGISILAQANQRPQGILTLLQNMI